MTRKYSLVPSSLALIAAASLGLAACGPTGAEPEEAQSRLRATLPQILDTTEASLTVLDEIPSMDWMLDSLSAFDASFAATPIDLGGNLTGEDGEDSGTAFKDETDMSSTLPDELATLIFNEESYEGDGYYLLRPETMCTDELTGDIDPECADLIVRAEIRLRALIAGDGLDIILVIGPDRSEPLTVELRSDLLALVVDLAEGKQAITHLATVTGEAAELPEVMEGVLAFSLLVHGDRDISLEAAVRERAQIEASVPGLGPITFSSEAKDPLFAVRLQGIERQVTFDVDIGETVLTMPWDMTSDNPLVGQTFRMNLAGVSSSTTLRADAQSLTISNIGLGDGTTSIMVDDHTLFAMDLNADLGRRYAMTVTPNADGLASFALEPGFDLAMTVDYSPLAAAGEVVEDFLLGQTYRVSFLGDGPVAEPVAPAVDGDNGGLRILSGTLTLSGTDADDVVVDAGQCLLANPTPELDAHPLLGYYVAGACP